MYQPLNVHQSAPDRVKRFIVKHVDMQFGDVHCMLRLPVARCGLRAGCNFAAASSLLGLIAGASVVLYEPERFWDNKDRELLFTGLLKGGYYPWLRKKPAVNPEEATNRLWEMYRNPFVHSLGVERPSKQEFKVLKGARSEREVVELEKPGPRPRWLHPTMVKEKSTIKLYVDALYWGTRRMVEALSADADRMERTKKLLEDLNA